MTIVLTFALTALIHKGYRKFIKHGTVTASFQQASVEWFSCFMVAAYIMGSLGF